MQIYQNTIKADTISCFGIGVHSGRKTQLTLKSAPDNFGIKFIRTDVKNLDNIIPLNINNIFDTTLSTSIKNAANISVSTIEHLLAALWSYNIDNLIIEIDGPEVPIMDGSSKAFMIMLECAGVKLLKSKRRYLSLLKDVSILENGSEIHATRLGKLKSSDGINIDLQIDFDSSAIGSQNFSLSSIETFKNEVGDSRTFGFIKDLDYLHSKGLAKGASLDNTIGIDQDNKILNPDGLRYENEFVKHKLLDLIGDLYSLSNPIIADIKGHKTSHHLNNIFLNKILENPNNFEYKTF